MRDKNIYLSIILPTYNRLKSLKEIFLESLKEQNFENYELIIVDDNSNDQTENYFLSDRFIIEFPDVAKKTKYLKNHHNLWAPASRNIWVKHAEGNRIWIVEDDIQFIDNQILSKAAQIIEEKTIENPAIKVVSPYLKIMNNRGYYSLPDNQICKIWRISGEIYFDPDKEINAYTDSTHCVTFIEKNIWDILWWQDDLLYIGNTFRDESDFYIRLQKLWYKIWYAWVDLKTAHRNDLVKTGGQKKVNVLPLYRQEFMVWENHYKFLAKNFNFPQIRVVIFVLIRVIKIFWNLLWVKFLRRVLANLWF